jgi:hypothetical protein
MFHQSMQHNDPRCASRYDMVATSFKVLREEGDVVMKVGFEFESRPIALTESDLKFAFQTNGETRKNGTMTMDEERGNNKARIISHTND